MVSDSLESCTKQVNESFNEQEVLGLNDNQEDFLQYDREVEVVSSPLQPPAGINSNEYLSDEELLDFGDPNDHSSDEYVPSSDYSSDNDYVINNNQPKPKNKPHNQEIAATENIPIVDDHEIEQQVEGNQAEALTPLKRKRGRKKVVGDGTRKRKRSSITWQRNVQKTKRNSGEEYTTLKGKLVPAKTLKNPCNCKKKCFEKIDELDRQAIFADFYSLTKEGKDQFLACNVKEENKQRQRLRRENSPDSRRKFTRKYSLTKGGGYVEVCQTMFLNTLDVTLKKVRKIVEKKRTSESGVCPEDKRGKHGQQPRISDDDKNFIREQIKRFPAYDSHYSRSHTIKKYLSPDLSISKMYKLYKEECNGNNIIPQSESFYRKIFVEEFNLQFKKPKNDTCAKCDKYEMIIKSSDVEEDRTKAEMLKNKHLDFAEAAYKQKQTDKTRSKNQNKVTVVSFDLQKCLPTPMLVNGVSFYKRQLWTFNLTLYETSHCLDKPQTRHMCFMWDETIAKRGSQEIASCLVKYLKELEPGAEEIIFYSDCCPGQTRNIFLSSMFLWIVEDFAANGRSLVIHHKFLEPGHTHMEADTIHARIEKSKKRTTANIELPRDWSTFIQSIDCQPKLKVYQMEQSEFLDFKSLLKTKYIKRTEDIKGVSVRWSEIRWIKYHYDQENPGQIMFKNSLVEEDPFEVLDISRKKSVRRPSQLGNLLSPISTSPLKLSKEKLQDLKSLLPYISTQSKMYYQTFIDNLKDCSDVEDVWSEFDDEN